MKEVLIKGFNRSNKNSNKNNNIFRTHILHTERAEFLMYENEF